MPVDIGAILEDERRIPFDGPSARLALLFESETLPGGADLDGFSAAAVAFESIGVRGTARVYFFDRDLAPFVRSLKVAHAALQGTAILESEEGDFRLIVTCAKGAVTLTGHLQPSHVNKTTLTYEIASDQSYMNAALLALNRIVPESQ